MAVLGKNEHFSLLFGVSKIAPYGATTHLKVSKSPIFWGRANILVNNSVNVYAFPHFNTSVLIGRQLGSHMSNFKNIY